MLARLGNSLRKATGNLARRSLSTLPQKQPQEAAVSHGHYAKLHHELKKARTEEEFHTPKADRDPYHRDQLDRARSVQPQLQQEMRALIAKRARELRETEYKGKTKDDEEKLLEELKGYIGARKDVDHTPELVLEIEARIKALRKVINHKFQLLAVVNRGFSIERTQIKDGKEVQRGTISAAERLGLDAHIFYFDFDEKTPAVQAVPPEKRHLVRFKHFEEDVKKGLLEIKAAAGEDADIGIELGIGLLAENLGFIEWAEKNGFYHSAQNVEAAKIIMDKGAYKEYCKKKGIPVPRTYTPDKEKEIDFTSGATVKVKQRVGGGSGKGNRDADSHAAIAKAKSELKGEVTVEDCFEDIEHIEFRIFQGRVLHRRKCDIQDPRNEKKLERTVSEKNGKDGKDESVTEMEKFAALLAKALLEEFGLSIGYTIEFIRDKKGRIASIEINLRRQMEDPVTDEALDFDLNEANLVALLERDVAYFLARKHGLSPTASMDEIISHLNKNAKAVRNMRVYAADTLPDVPTKGDTFPGGLEGEVVSVNDAPEGTYLGIQPGTRFNYPTTQMNPQIGGILGTGKTVQEADQDLIFKASKLKVNIRLPNGIVHEHPLTIPHGIWMLDKVSRLPREQTNSWAQLNKQYTAGIRRQKAEAAAAAAKAAAEEATKAASEAAKEEAAAASELEASMAVPTRQMG